MARNEVIPVRTSKETKEKLKEYCNENNKSISEVCHTAIQGILEPQLDESTPIATLNESTTAINKPDISPLLMTPGALKIVFWGISSYGAYKAFQFFKQHL